MGRDPQVGLQKLQQGCTKFEKISGVFPPSSGSSCLLGNEGESALRGALGFQGSDRRACPRGRCMCWLGPVAGGRHSNTALVWQVPWLVSDSDKYKLVSTSAPPFPSPSSQFPSHSTSLLQ